MVIYIAPNCGMNIKSSYQKANGIGAGTKDFIKSECMGRISTAFHTGNVLQEKLLKNVAYFELSSFVKLGKLGSDMNLSMPVAIKFLGNAGSVVNGISTFAMAVSVIDSGIKYQQGDVQVEEFLLRSSVATLPKVVTEVGLIAPTLPGASAGLAATPPGYVAFAASVAFAGGYLCGKLLVEYTPVGDWTIPIAERYLRKNSGHLVRGGSW
jgi:hypothetical protein